MLIGWPLLLNGIKQRQEILVMTATGKALQMAQYRIGKKEKENPCVLDFRKIVMQ